MREKNGTGLRKKKKKEEEETKELCDWAVGFKMRREREREWNRFKKKKKEELCDYVMGFRMRGGKRERGREED